jgi:16S rRNA (guanine527-N7)-methyltransferase
MPQDPKSGKKSPLGREIIDAAAFGAAFAVSRETLEKLACYAILLKRWQAAVNLVAPKTLDHIWHRHFADSAQVFVAAGEVSATANWLDVGSGAGFPGLVIALLRADAGHIGRMTLVESDTRKAAFLSEVARHVTVAVDIVNARIEDAATHRRLGTQHVISARALAPLAKLLGLVEPYVGPETVCVFPKGREADAEIVNAAQHWTFDLASVVSLTEHEARILVLRHIAPKIGGRP